MARALDGTIAVRSQKLLGLVPVRDLDALGVSRQMRRSLVSSGVLSPVHRGVYRHTAHPVSWRQTLLAGLLATGSQSAASFTAAAAWWRFEGAARTPAPIELSLVPPARRRAPAGVVLHRPEELCEADLDQVGPVRLTTPARTLCDLAPRLTPNELKVTLDHATRRRLIWLPHLRWRLASLRRRGRPGIPELHALVETDAIDMYCTESWLETEGLRRIADAGLPFPRCQAHLRTRTGPRGTQHKRRARVDLFWDDARLVVELNGHTTHATRHDLQRDAERNAALELEGWRVVTFVYDDIAQRPDYVIDTIAAHLAALDALD
jgi:hypothetical protein